MPSTATAASATYSTPPVIHTTEKPHINNQIGDQGREEQEPSNNHTGVYLDAEYAESVHITIAPAD